MQSPAKLVCALLLKGSVELKMEEGRRSSHRLFPPEGEAGRRWREVKNLEPFEEGSGGAL